jgi:hypothetical protein
VFLNVAFVNTLFATLVSDRAWTLDWKKAKKKQIGVNQTQEEQSSVHGDERTHPCLMYVHAQHCWN